MPGSACLDENAALELVGGRLDSGHAERAHAHAADCDACHELIAVVAKVVAADSGRDVGPGTVIGAYQIEREVGSGGMGVVYAARDRKLRRTVALKLLHPRASSAPAAARLVQEAQVMARLAHPNVVTALEVGRCAHGTFVAMEFVDGQTLREWSATRQRTWGEVLAILRDAGAGLAAAHAAGIVHRDFKPQNVLIGNDGRARVVDFGLAVAVPTSSEAPAPTGEPLTRLTRTGRVVGTPAYMAPEQFRGQTADERSDQFAFAIVLYEALCGERPFAGKDFASLCTNVLEARLNKPKRGRIPAWLWRPLARGLALEPDDRHADMQSFLSTLRPRRRSAWVLPATGVLAAGLTAALAWPAPAAKCGSDPQLRGVWDAERRAEVEAALRGTGRRYADATARHTADMLDDYAATWLATYRNACSSEHETALDQRMACLRTRRHELSALVDLVVRQPAGTVDVAADVAVRLSPVDDCTDEAYLATRAPPPSDPRHAAVVEAGHEAFARARVAINARAFEQARAAVAELEAGAAEVDYPPLVAELLLVRGVLRTIDGERVAGDKDLRDAFFAARKLGQDSRAFDAAAVVAHVAGIDRADPEDAAIWLRHAQASAPPDDAERTVALLALTGDLAVAADDFVTAETAFVAARALFDEHEVSPGRQSDLYASLGSLYARTDRPEAAIVALQEGLAANEASLGEHHPDAATLLNALGVVYVKLDRFAEAAEQLEEALAVLEDSRGRDSVMLAYPLGNLAVLYGDQGHGTKALATLERAEAIFVTHYGARHPEVGSSYSNTASQLQGLGRCEEAVAKANDALDVFLGAPKPLRRAALQPLKILARAHEDCGRTDAALGAWGRMAELIDDLQPPDPDYRDWVTQQAARTRRGQADPR